jgi:1-acyl-sn-glycerol-3-phosphate acyltransferase
VTIRTKLPKKAPLLHKLTYPFFKPLFYFYFGYMPYGPVRRENLPDLSSPLIVAGSHSNFLCDTVIHGFDTLAPSRFLGKHTLFRFPIKLVVGFWGAIPVYRPQDAAEVAGEGRALQNRTSFKAAIQALEDGWPVCIYPEGGSYMAPGLNLPLKPGVAKLAFSAEEVNEFKLGTKIVAIGLEYGSRPKVVSGLIIRYSEPLYLKNYQKLYEEDYSGAVTQLMADLTERMKQVYPHFENDEELAMAKRLTALGVATSRMEVSRTFAKYRKTHPKFAHDLHQRLHVFEEESKELGIPLGAWGYRRRMAKMSKGDRMYSLFILTLGLPFFLFDLINNTFPEFIIRSIMGFVASDETEMMTFRFVGSIFIVPFLYLGQLWVVSRYFAPDFFTTVTFSAVYLVYFVFSVAVWRVMHGWRRTLKLWMAQLFFTKKPKGEVHGMMLGLERLSAWVRGEGGPSTL